MAYEHAGNRSEHSFESDTPAAAPGKRALTDRIQRRVASGTEAPANAAQTSAPAPTGGAHWQETISSDVSFVDSLTAPVQRDTKRAPTAGPSAEDRGNPDAPWHGAPLVLPSTAHDLRARVIGREQIGNTIRLQITAGFAQGAKVGMTGYLTDESGRPNTDFELAEVDERISIAYVHDSHDNVVAHRTVVINPSKKPSTSKSVQRKGDAHTGLDEGAVQALAGQGIAGGGGPLPFLDEIQRSFGPHDVSGVVAHTDAAAAKASTAIGASAFASGNHVAFGGAPDLFTAAHEAAHVVQQRAGVHLKGGVGQSGDQYEQHADAVAARVVAGESAADLLGSTGSASTAAVQRRENEAEPAPTDTASTGNRGTVPTSWYVNFKGAGAHGRQGGSGSYDLTKEHGERTNHDVLILEDLHVGPQGRKGRAFANQGNALPHGAAHVGEFDHPKGEFRASGVALYAAPSDIKIVPTWGTPPGKEDAAKARAAEKAAKDYVVAEIRRLDSPSEGDWSKIRAAAAERAESVFPDHQPTVAVSFDRTSQRFPLGAPYRIDSPAQCVANFTVPTTTVEGSYSKTIGKKDRVFEDTRTHTEGHVAIEAHDRKTAGSHGEAEDAAAKTHVGKTSESDKTKSSVDTKVERSEVLKMASEVTSHIHRVAHHGWSLAEKELETTSGKSVINVHPPAEPVPAERKKTKSWLREKFDGAVNKVTDVVVDGLAKAVKQGVKQYVTKRLPRGDVFFTPIGWGIDWLADKAKGKLHIGKSKDEPAPKWDLDDAIGIGNHTTYKEKSQVLDEWIREVRDIVTREEINSTKTVNSMFQSHWEHEHDSKKEDLLVESESHRAKASADSGSVKDTTVTVKADATKDVIKGRDTTDEGSTTINGTWVEIRPGHPVMTVDVLKEE